MTTSTIGIHDLEDWTLPEEREAQLFWQKFQAENKILDLRKLFSDFVSGEISSAFFVLIICWSWSDTKVNQNGIKYLSWWAIWSSCEDFIYDERLQPSIEYEWNDEKELKERVQLALDGNYQEIWHRLGISEDELKEMEKL